MKTILGVILFTSVISYAQIDTSVYYPMHIGDKWEYYTPGDGYSIVAILGDTLMPNGYNYFIFSLVNRKYQRLDSNYFVKIYKDSDSSEFTRYDFYSPKGTIIDQPWQPNSYGWGIFDIGTDLNNLLNQDLEWREFRSVSVDTTVIPYDTLWVNLVDLYWPRITKGIGVTSYANGFQELVGAYINGVGYGTLVSVKETNNETPGDFTLYQNYPNPFNPATTIRYQLPKDGMVTLKVYDILGREIKTLVNDFKNKGRYEVNFDASRLSSGMYIYQITSGSYKASKKMSLIK